MKVFVNNHEISIFAGARIDDAVLAYSKHSWKRMKTGKLIVFDRFGFTTDPDGPLIESQKIFLKRK